MPGLAAKPIIDMTLIVPDSSDEDSYVRHLEAVGYVLRIREPEWHEHRVFKGPDTAVVKEIIARAAAARAQGLGIDA